MTCTKAQDSVQAARVAVSNIRDTVCTSRLVSKVGMEATELIVIATLRNLDALMVYARLRDQHEDAARSDDEEFGMD